MTELNTQLLKTLSRRVRHSLLEEAGIPMGQPLLLAVSGGADSVALSECIHDLGHWPTTLLFIDHGFRNVDAEKEAAYQAAKRHGAPFMVKELGLEKGSNLQARARRARYLVLNQVAEELGAFIATGHTKSDQGETLLARLIRGSGIQGLRSLRPRQGRLLRPMLQVSREETRALGAHFVDDPSNASDAYERNRIRHHLMPLFKKENPDIEGALADLARAAEGERKLLSVLWESHLETSLPLPLSKLDENSLLALCHHVASAEGASPSKEALRLWAKHVLLEGKAKVSLGDGYLGRFSKGRLFVEAAHDPRQSVLISGPGHFALAKMAFEARLTPKEGGLGLPLWKGPYRLQLLAGAASAQRDPSSFSKRLAFLSDKDKKLWAYLLDDGRWELTEEGKKEAKGPEEEGFYLFRRG